MQSTGRLFWKINVLFVRKTRGWGKKQDVNAFFLSRLSGFIQKLIRTSARMLCVFQLSSNVFKLRKSWTAVFVAMLVVPAWDTLSNRYSIEPLCLISMTMSTVRYLISKHLLWHQVSLHDSAPDIQVLNETSAICAAELLANAQNVHVRYSVCEIWKF